MPMFNGNCSLQNPPKWWTWAAQPGKLWETHGKTGLGRRQQSTQVAKGFQRGILAWAKELCCCQRLRWRARLAWEQGWAEMQSKLPCKVAPLCPLQEGLAKQDGKRSLIAAPTLFTKPHAEMQHCSHRQEESDANNISYFLTQLVSSFQFYEYFNEINTGGLK